MGHNRQSNDQELSNTRMAAEQVNERKKIREGEQPSGLPMGGFLSLTPWPDPGGGSRVVPRSRGTPPFLRFLSHLSYSHPPAAVFKSLLFSKHEKYRYFS